MLINDNGVIREMTEEEKANYNERIAAQASENETEVQTLTLNSSDALTAFFAALASSETNSIAKIRAAAQEFLQKTGGAQT